MLHLEYQICMLGPLHRGKDGRVRRGAAPIGRVEVGATMHRCAALSLASILSKKV